MTLFYSIQDPSASYRALHRLHRMHIGCFSGSDRVTIFALPSSSSYSYRWTKNNRSLEEELDDARYSIAADGDGGLTVRDASEADAGVFRCYASNRYGVAVTVKTQLRMAGIHAQRYVIS